MSCLFTASQPVHSLGSVLAGGLKEHFRIVTVVMEHPCFCL